MTKAIATTVGRRLGTLLGRRGLSISELARRAGVHRVTISKIIHGRDSNPTTETLDLLAKALDASVAELVGGATTVRQ